MNEKSQSIIELHTKAGVIKLEWFISQDENGWVLNTTPLNWELKQVTVEDGVASYTPMERS